jgi:hypothetical protein
VAVLSVRRTGRAGCQHRGLPRRVAVGPDGEQCATGTAQGARRRAPGLSSRERRGVRRRHRGARAASQSTHRRGAPRPTRRGGDRSATCAPARDEADEGIHRTAARLKAAYQRNQARPATARRLTRPRGRAADGRWQLHNAVAAVRRAASRRRATFCAVDPEPTRNCTAVARVQRACPTRPWRVPCS